MIFIRFFRAPALAALLRHPSRLIPLLLAGFAVCAGPGQAAETRRPNVVVILSDDMGFSDLGCYGSEIKTPHLDGLARDGLRFTQFYNMARCCPTRASLLTGLYPHQAGVGHMVEDKGAEGYRGTLNRQCVTIAEALKPAGYRSYAAGKWHITPGHSAKELENRVNWPLQRGFDRYYGTIHGAGSYFDPSSLVRDNQLVTVANDVAYRPKEYFYTDAISDHAVRFIGDHARAHAAQPFFLYVAYTAAHWPLHAPEADIAKYKGRYDGGYEPIRQARWEKQKKLGLVKGEWGTVPASDAWEDVKDKAFESRCMEVYAAQIDNMDQGIGRIVAELKARGQFENTLILFLQDNGGCAEPVGRGGKSVERAAKPALPPMGPNDEQYGSQPKQTRDGWPVRQGYGVMPGGPDTYIAYGRGWANVSNTPFREYKHWTHEGGISTPLIAHWPAGMAPARRNQLEPAPTHLIDVMATCLDLAGAKYPKEYKGEKIKSAEGISLRPLFAGQSISRAQPIFWEHEGNRAVRDGSWKLVSKENQPWELYDMERDRTEQHDLASAEPARAQQLAKQWDAYAARADVLPLGTWRGKREGTGGSTRATRFALKAGDRLERAQSPAIAGRGFTITARFTAQGTDGVIVAQGGSSLGYTLYLAEGWVHFLVRNRAEVASVRSATQLKGRHQVVARCDAAGGLSLQVDDQPAVLVPSKALIGSVPQDGLNVGSDEGGLVGPYSNQNTFPGAIESVVVEVDAR